MLEIENSTFVSIRIRELPNRMTEFCAKGLKPFNVLLLSNKDLERLLFDEGLMTRFIARSIFGSLNSSEFKQFLKAKVKTTGVNIMKRSCTDERPCINCYADQGPCLGKYVDKTSFEQAVEPLMKWLSENVHPHHTVIVSATTAELLEGTRCHNTDKYLVD